VKKKKEVVRENKPEDVNDSINDRDELSYVTE